jgi:hypothetical protein
MRGRQGQTAGEGSSRSCRGLVMKEQTTKEKLLLPPAPASCPYLLPPVSAVCLLSEAVRLFLRMIRLT